MEPIKNPNQFRQGQSTYRSGYAQTNRNLGTNQSPQSPQMNKPKKRTHKFRNSLFLLVLVLIIGGIFYSFNHHDKSAVYHSVATTIKSVSSKPIVTAVNYCSGNSLSKNVIVVISKQHLYACDYSKAVFNSPVITGYDGNPSNITPVGTYSIFKKFTNVNLTGSDDLGPWNVHVSYWMPFLFNQYGAYGLHDATWRKPDQFGHISPNSKQASHGCVECPLATAKWLYNWLNVGSTVTIEQA